MKSFMDENFLLATQTAQELFHEYAENMPIIDYHCHVSPQEIYEDRGFENITQAWLGGDHYKWRLMRSNGVEERYITGDADDRTKFQKFAETLPMAIGNPMYHWCHLELKKYFGYNGVLNGDTAERVWNLCGERLREPGMSVRGLINQSSVAFIGTTDDPADSLEWHIKIKNDPSFKAAVAPSFRPDKAFNIEKDGWKEYIGKLADVSDTEISDSTSLEEALAKRIAFFDELGCRASDHGLDYLMFRPSDRPAVDAVFRKGINNEVLTVEEIELFKTWMLLFCARQYAKYGWVFQIHYNCRRNPNKRMFKELGPDTGYDVINTANCAEAVVGVLNALEETAELPRTILYSLNPADNQLLDSIIGAFQSSEIPGKIQHGCAWWFNDTKSGMQEQIKSFANLSLLGNFIGMLTDSRSFLSYARHEYFRRILCDIIGKWVENGEYPNDVEFLGKLVQDISFNNARRYFNLAPKD